MGSKPLTAFAIESFSPRSYGAESRRPGIDAAISLLAVLGLICAWAAEVILVETAGVGIDRDGRLLFVAAKSLPFYGTHGLSLACMMAAGLLAVFSGRLRNIAPGARIGLYVLFSVTAIWAAVSYKWTEAFSTEIFGATGSFVWLTLVFAVAAADRRIWTYIDPTLRILSYATTVLALHALAGEYGAYRGFSQYIQYSILLTWLGGWTLLTATRLRGWRLAIRTIPAITLVAMAILSQSRSWTMLSLLLFATFVLLRAWERGSVLQGLRALGLGLAACAVLGTLVYAVAPGTFNEAANGLMARAMDDTRTDQYVEFFQSVPATDLVLGRGPKGTWYWPTIGDYQFFDNGYLWLLFEGGLPILLCYSVIVLLPALRTFRRGSRGGDAAAACLGLFWALALTGLSTYVLPSVGLSDCIVFLCAGRCHLFLAERQRAAKRAARARYGGDLNGFSSAPPSVPAASFTR